MGGAVSARVPLTERSGADEPVPLSDAVRALVARLGLVREEVADGPDAETTGTR